MIQSSNMARLGGDQRQRTRLRNTAGLVLGKGDPWFGRTARQGFLPRKGGARHQQAGHRHPFNIDYRVMERGRTVP